MEYATIAGNYYTITSKNGCSVTDATGTLDESVDEGKQLTVQAPSDKLIFDDEEAIVFKAPFNQALTALGMLGGGKHKLPGGYTRVDFLESSGTQYINLNKIPDDSTGGKITGCYASMRVLHGEPSLLGSYGSEYVRFWVSMLSSANANGERTMAIGWNNAEPFGEVINEGDIVESSLNYKNSRKYTMKKNGIVYEKTLSDSLNSSDSPLMFFAQKRGSTLYCLTSGRIYKASISQGNTRESNFIPALDSTGTPCMYDIVSKQPFHNKGTKQFIAGVKDASQLRTVLHSLPDLTGRDMGTLTLSIPEEANTPAMQELLGTTETLKNWELTTQERAAEVATYSLRRMRKVVWVRRTMSEYGGYVAADGSRWLIEWCSAIYSPRGNDPTLHGYEPFGSVEEAAETWGLEPYIDPNAEDELLTEV